MDDTLPPSRRNQGNDPEGWSGGKTRPPHGNAPANPPHGQSAASADEPHTIAGYRIQGILGKGGMGVVYRAEQPSPRRVVALKVIAGEFVTPELLRRFEHEADTLARLKHNGIAQIYEAGIDRSAADRGQLRPFFAMELIEDALPIDAYADRQRLAPRARLRLLAEVCDAVQYAHQQGVIHRDLKPANVLVTRNGEPKIIDFGVARVTDADVNATTMHTEVHQLIGTLAYMSPEQAGGQTADVDTRSDVYALGVIGYQLLSGRMPHDLGKRMLHEAIRVIREEEPSRLSSVDRTFRGDLETIVAKALDKEKDRRYASASDFAADVRRFLDDQPITARPAGTWYQARKFARRNRALVGGLVATFAMLVLGALVSATFAVRATRGERLAEARRLEAERQKNTAQTQAQIATEVSAFLTNMFNQATPEQSLGKTATAIDIVDKAVVGLQGRLGDNDEVKAALEFSLGNALNALGKAAEAEPLLKDASDRRSRALGPDHPDTIAALSNYAAAIDSLGRVREAFPLLQTAFEQRKRTLGIDHPDTLFSMTAYAFSLLSLDRNAESAALFDEAFRRRKAVLGADHPDTLLSENNYGTALLNLERVEESSVILKDVWDRRVRVSGADHPDTIIAEANYAGPLEAEGHFEQSCPIYLDVYTRSQKVWGADHPNTLVYTSRYASALANLGRFDEAAALAKQAMDDSRRALGEDHPITLKTTAAYASILDATNRSSEAIPLLKGIFDADARSLGWDHDSTLSAASNYALALCQAKRADEAEPLLKTIVERREATLGPDHSRTIASVNNYAYVLNKLGRTADAAPVYLDALNRCARVLGASHPDTLRMHNNYAYVMAALGDGVQAEAHFREAMRRAATQPALGPKHPMTLEYASHDAQVLEQTGRHDEAMAVCREFGLASPMEDPSTRPTTQP